MKFLNNVARFVGRLMNMMQKKKDPDNEVTVSPELNISSGKEEMKEVTYEGDTGQTIKSVAAEMVALANRDGCNVVCTSFGGGLKLKAVPCEDEKYFADMICAYYWNEARKQMEARIAEVCRRKKEAASNTTGTTEEEELVFFTEVECRELAHELGLLSGKVRTRQAYGFQSGRTEDEFQSGCTEDELRTCIQWVFDKETAR